LSAWYLSRPRRFRYEDINLKIHPGVFHPGLFFSTKVLLTYLQELSLRKLRFLELGAGSGLISIWAARRGAIVTASDISSNALDHLKENARENAVDISIVHSDLFERFSPADFDLIVINPPYYPKDPVTEKDFAWYCGSDYSYFQRLFKQLQLAKSSLPNVLMILSEDCRIDAIREIAERHALKLDSVREVRTGGELNYIFKITVR
jgi:release factor glutamine methyltransferase